MPETPLTSVKAKVGLSRSYFLFPPISGQNPWLDFLRAWAILFVFFRHGEWTLTTSNIDTLPSNAAWPLHNFFINGWIGVDIFLVLSGYLIAKSLHKTMDATQNIDVRTYFTGRILRIVPAYYAVLFLTAIGGFPYFPVSPENMGLRLLYHLLFLQDYFPSDINVVFWSLGVEEKFYLIAPVLFVVLLKLSRPALLFTCFAALLCISPGFKLWQFIAHNGPLDYQTFVYNYRMPFHISLEPLIIGMCVCFLHIRNICPLSTQAAKYIFTVTALILSMFLTSHELMGHISLWDVTLQPLFLAILSGLLVYSAIFMSGIKIAGERVWRILSRLSYVLYLVHFALIPFAQIITLALSLPPICFWGIYAGLSLLTALLIHFCIEKPFMQLKHRLALKHQTHPRAESLSR